MHCKCTLAQRAVGDGCDVCNPTQALEYAREEIESLRQQLNDSEESNKAVYLALEDVDYRGSYADGVKYLKQQVAAAQNERDAWCHQVGAILDTIPLGSVLRASGSIGDAVAYFKKLQENASALKAHHDALIERIARHMSEHGPGTLHVADAVRALKGKI